MTEFKQIPLSEIHPDKNQPRKFFDDHAIKELTDSIVQKGVLQPVMVRPNGNGYILVCGERRLKASTAAGLKDVPAVIRNLTDEEALEIQFIENIQRSDVHPMDEATTFKQMLENKVHAYTIADIAAKINKPESYVAHRLALNNLIKPLQKEFWSGKFLIGHAVLFARLSPDDQKLVDKDCREWSSKEFKSVNEVRSYIDINIMNNLSSATFKKDDVTLNPEMGACTTCQFRSGANATLFNDIKETDRCFKPVCFEKKSNAAIVATVKDLIEQRPETIFLDYGYGKTIPEIAKLLADFKIKPLKDSGGFSTYQHTGYKKAKGFWINGIKVGKFETIYLKGLEGEKSPGNNDTGDSVNYFDVEIAGIKQRTERAAELDDEKVWLRIHNEIINVNKDKGGLDINMELINDKKLSAIDTAAIIYAMQDKAGSESQEILKLFGVNRYSLYGNEGFIFYKKLLNATPEQFNQVCRIFIKGVLDNVTSSHTANAGLGILKQVAEQYKKSEIEAFEAEQKEKREKREARAAVRIKALKESKKQAEAAKAEKKADVKKSSTKKSASVSKKKGKGIKALLK